MTNKPREFWIYPFKPAKMLFTYTEPNELKQSAPENFDEIHVIEYSAYQALLEQAERMAQQLEAIHKLVGSKPFSNADRWGNVLETVWRKSEDYKAYHRFKSGKD